MSRTTLCIITAAVLAVFSLTSMVTRYRVLGGEVRSSGGPQCWKVTLLIHGTSEGDARLSTCAPLDMGRQHLLSEEYTSVQLLHKPPDEKQPGRRQVHWTRRVNETDGPFRVRCEYQLALDVLHPSTTMTRVAQGLAAAPQAGEHLDRAGSEHEQITAKARELTGKLNNSFDVAEVLYRYVDREVKNEPSIGAMLAGATDCLKAVSGDCAAKSRLLVALLRNRGIPARLVAGVSVQHKVSEQRTQYWVEAWVRERWLPMCPSQHYFGKVPSSYLVFAYGDQPLVRGKHIKDLDYGFLIEQGSSQAEEVSGLKRFFQSISLFKLAPGERHLVEFLLLLPVAALIICIYRNLIGLNSFGLFAPALVGLAFRDLHSLPGILVFVSILLIGWLMRRVLDSYHLLQVPRVALMLSLIVIVLILCVVTANSYNLPATRYVSLFPMIILTGMVERFWTLENEDSIGSSFKTLLTTMLIASTISVVLSFHVIIGHLYAYPETLGLIMAVQLLIGRYTGYRLMELFRFRDFLTEPVVS